MKNTPSVLRNLLTVALVFSAPFNLVHAQTPVPAQATLSTATAEAPATQAPTVPKKWKCKADNLVSGNYSGGKYAFIHLSPYHYGGSYAATVNGDVATGTTKDGTPFECRLE